MKTLQIEIVFKYGTELRATIFKSEWDADLAARKPGADFLFTDTEGFMYTIAIKDILYYRTKEM